MRSDCFDNCGDPISDGCIKYTGNNIPLLGIKKGDPVSRVERLIIEKLVNVSRGSGIDLTEVSLEDCPYLLGAFKGKDKTLTNLLQLLVDQHCSLRAFVEDSLCATTFIFDTACLDVKDDAGKDDILQAIVTKLCAISAVVDKFPSTYVKSSELTTLVQAILNNTGTTTTVIQSSAKMVPDVAYPYFGSISNFDSSGKGIASVGFDKVYLCNGANGTPDIRGRVVVAAVKNVPGGALDSAVDPQNSNNPNMNLAVGDKLGESYHKLTVQEIPSHSHTVNDPGHSHTVPIKPTDGARCSGGDCEKPNGTNSNMATSLSTTGISVAATGGTQAHLNVQPSIVANYIMYKP